MTVTYDELIDFFKKLCGSLSAEQLEIISRSGLVGSLQTAAITRAKCDCPTPETCQEAGRCLVEECTGEPYVKTTAAMPKKIGRPVGSKDKKPRKSRRKSGGTGETMAEE